MSSVINEKYYFKEEAAFRDLPESAQRALADRLMPDSAWKTVADRLGFSANGIETLEAKFATAGQSAHQMLRQWSQRHGSTLRVLRQTLSGIERRDIIAILDEIRKRKSKSSGALYSGREYARTTLGPR